MELKELAAKLAELAKEEIDALFVAVVAHHPGSAAAGKITTLSTPSCPQGQVWSAALNKCVDDYGK